MTTDALLRAAERSRDKVEFEVLFLAHYEAVYRLLFRILGSSQEAEDLAQETFLRLYGQRFPQGREHHVRSWLYRVATNLAYNALRGQRRRERRQEALYGAQAAGDEGTDPSEALLRKDEQESVRHVLASLPSRQAELLLLRYAGLSYSELAEALSLAPGSVGTLLARAEAAFEAAYRTTILVPAERRKR